MNITDWLNLAQEYGLISDNCITLQDVHLADYAVAVSYPGAPKL